MDNKYHPGTEETGFELRPQNPKIKLALRYIEEHLEENVSVDDLVKLTGYAYHYFCHQFKTTTGFSVKSYLIARKMHRAARLLASGKKNSDVSKLCGYNNTAEFSRAFRKYYNITPSQYLKSINQVFRSEPVIRRLKAKSVIGYRFEAPKDSNFKPIEHGAYWAFQTFNQAYSDNYNVYDPVRHGECGLWVPAEYCGNAEPFYLYGTPVDYANAVPNFFAEVRLQECDYALFPVEIPASFADLSKSVCDTYSYVIYEWLPNSEHYLNNATPIVEYYRGDKVFLCVPLQSTL